MPDTMSTESLPGGQTAGPAANASPAAGVLERSGVFGEVPLAKGELTRDEDLLSLSFQHDIEAVVSPLAVLAAVLVLLASIRRVFKVQEKRQRERASASVEGAIDAR